MRDRYIMFLDEVLNENENLFDIEDGTEERQYCEGAEGILEIALESEMSWSNIVMETVKDEFVAIKNESSVLLEEAKDNWFKRVIAWVKEKAKKVAEFFRHIIQKLMVQFTNVDKFCKKYASAIGSAKANGSAKVFGWKNANVVQAFTDCITTMMSSTSAKEVLSVEDLSRKHCGVGLADISTKLPALVRSEKREVKEVTPQMAQKALGELPGLKKGVSEIKNLQKAQDMQLKRAESVAKEGLIGNKDDKALKNQITTIKNINSLTDRITAVAISTLNQQISDYIVTCRAVLHGSKVADKAEAKKESTGLLFDLV